MNNGRGSSVELLRIIAMLMIVAGHFLDQSGALSVHQDSFMAMFWGSGARIACNIFLLIGCWFMVDVTYSGRRPLRLYLTVIFYTIPLTVIAGILGGNPSTKDIARGFMPFTGRALWFASAYITLMLLSPWFQKVFELPRSSLLRLLCLLTILLSGICTLPDPQVSYVLDSVWFAYVYLIVGYVKKYYQSFTVRIPRFFGLCVGVAVYVLLVSGRYYGNCWALQCLSDFKTLPNLLCSLLIFQYFLRKDFGIKVWLNCLAKGAFAVYVIHQTPAFYDFLWQDLFHCKNWIAGPMFCFGGICVVFSVYLAGTAIELFRISVIEPRYLKSRVFVWMAGKIEFRES